jgi:pimeloyl-ACP methyl ester carboxylesterase
MKSFLFIIILTILHGCKSEPGNFITTADGIDLYYESHGSGEPTLVFIHGWTCDATAWNNQISYFKDKYRVVVLDLPGFGRSGLNRKNWIMERYGADVEELVNELKMENIILIGHSLGGCVILEAAKKFQNKVSAIVLVDVLRSLTTHYDSTYVINFYNTIRENYKNLDFLSDYFGKDTTLARRYVVMTPSNLPESWLPILKENFRWCNEDDIPSVSELLIPIRAINSDRSETKFDEWNTYTEDFKAVIFENCGHYVHWEYPDKFNRSLEDLIQEIIE